MKKRVSANLRISGFWHQIARSLLGGLFRFTHRIKVEGENFVPRSGGVIVAANHQSLWDPPVLGYALTHFIGRRPYYLAKAELFKNLIVAWLFPRLGAIALNRRSNDPAAMIKAVGLLERGEALAVFPEGSRKRESSLVRFLPGVGFLAMKAKVPIIPCYISYESSWPAFGSEVSLRFGPCVTAQIGAKETVDLLLEQVKLLAEPRSS